MNADDQQQPNPIPGAPVTAARRARLNHTLPTDRIGFTKQVDIIRAYAAAYDKLGGPVGNSDVASFVGMAEATVAMANAFLTDTGLLSGDAGKFTPTQPLIEYFKVHQFSPERAWAKLAPLFERSWFGLELIPKLKIRPIDESEAINDLAIASNAEKKHLGQLKVGIDWLVQVGLIIREGQQLKLAPFAMSGGNQDNAGNQNTPPVEKPAAPVAPKPPSEVVEEGLQRSVLPLDASTKRRLVIWAPPTVTPKELERIQQWLSFQLIVAGEDPK
jgi:hypothetical protein